LAEQLSNITLKLKDYVKVHNLKLAFTRTQTSVIFQDGNMEFIRNDVNKAVAIDYLLKEYGMQPEDLLVAGNAINDAEMLNVAAKHRVLVGDGEVSDAVFSYLINPKHVSRVKTPADLGGLLATLK
jgi:hydroxymethylpyrimidine pyrophosphatase-like HAD family hydrolase